MTAAHPAEPPQLPHASTAFVAPTEPLTEENAWVALHEACALVGRDASNAQLIRLGSNAVFRLQSAPVIARVMRSSTQLADATREVRVSRWLSAVGIPAVEATDDTQPVVANGRTVTFWTSVADAEEYGSTVELGSILRRLHEQPLPDSLQLPPFSPFDRAWERIDRSPALTTDDRHFMTVYGRQLSVHWPNLVYALKAGPIHGDANVGNLLRCANGGAVLSDLDGFGIGPREWDLILTAMYFERYGWHTESEYREFCDSYGFDVMAWPGYKTLADTREFLMVTWLSQNAASGSSSEGELRRRIKTLRSGDGRAEWQPF
jgi:aminoglycoside phosphotransferase (APT) family kinase protein